MGFILYFLRHGETQASQTGGYCGVSDVALTPEGYQMAADFAAAYKSLPWAAVFCSPYAVPSIPPGPCAPRWASKYNRETASGKSLTDSGRGKLPRR